MKSNLLTVPWQALVDCRPNSSGNPESGGCVSVSLSLSDFLVDLLLGTRGPEVCQQIGGSSMLIFSLPMSSNRVRVYSLYPFLSSSMDF